MSLVILGKTACALCGEPLLEGQLIQSLPPFVWNEADPLYAFSDAAFHEDCLQRDPASAQVHAAVSEILGRTGPGRRTCAVCSVEVDDPDDYLLLPRLTGDKRHAAHRFNYIHLHKSHVARWEEYETAMTALRSLSSLWRGEALQHLLEELETARQS